MEPFFKTSEQLELELLCRMNRSVIAAKSKKIPLMGTPKHDETWQEKLFGVHDLCKV